MYHLSLRAIIKRFYIRIGLTWTLVFIEHAMIACVTLLIGKAIDGLLTVSFTPLLWLIALFIVIEILATLRRFYDTRAYGYIKAVLAMELAENQQHLPISTQNARLDMVRELVDFLEKKIPEAMSGVVQMLVIGVILFQIYIYLGISVIAMSALTLAAYALFHKRFFRLNAMLNNRAEQQVRIVGLQNLSKLNLHIQRLRKIDIKLSDTEAISFWLIFTIQSAFIVINLLLSAQIENASVGDIVIIISYSWEFFECCILLPMNLQIFSRLQEIMQRLNQQSE
ncbi:MAG: ABC transporter six-transmembrane domain-containing protein [Alphaproteobacteria bacterium]|nr:ABC transporter six-transmembrane domain-containing protein [Alphaproteobacteria bacterium]